MGVVSRAARASTPATTRASPPSQHEPRTAPTPAVGSGEHVADAAQRAGQRLGAAPGDRERQGAREPQRATEQRRQHGHRERPARRAHPPREGDRAQARQEHHEGTQGLGGELRGGPVVAEDERRTGRDGGPGHQQRHPRDEAVQPAEQAEVELDRRPSPRRRARPPPARAPPGTPRRPVTRSPPRRRAARRAPPAPRGSPPPRRPPRASRAASRSPRPSGRGAARRLGVRRAGTSSRSGTRTRRGERSGGPTAGARLGVGTGRSEAGRSGAVAVRLGVGRGGGGRVRGGGSTSPGGGRCAIAPAAGRRRPPLEPRVARERRLALPRAGLVVAGRARGRDVDGTARPAEGPVVVACRPAARAPSSCHRRPPPSRRLPAGRPPDPTQSPGRRRGARTGEVAGRYGRPGDDKGRREDARAPGTCWRPCPGVPSAGRSRPRRHELDPEHVANNRGRGTRLLSWVPPPDSCSCRDDSERQGSGPTAGNHDKATADREPWPERPPPCRRKRPCGTPLDRPQERPWDPDPHASAGGSRSRPVADRAPSG